MNPTFRLIMQTGPTPGRDIPLQKSELFIGRDLNNDIVVNDAEVSRRHARLFLKGTNYYLEDLGSTNGSFVNGQRLSAPVQLRPGEIITFGERINLIFESLTFTQAPAASVPAAGIEKPETKPEEAPVPIAPVLPSVEPSPKLQSAPPQPVAQQASSFSGQVPSTVPDAAPKIKTRIPTWVWIVLVIETILLIFFIIDDARLWCPLFGWALNAIFPGSCSVQ